MAIAFRSASAKATDGTDPYSVTPDLPAGMVANDIVILVAATESTGTATLSAAGSVTTWTAITGSPVAVTGGKKLYVWWGRWASGTTGPTITATTNMIIAATAAWSGCDTTSSVINNQANGNEDTADTSLSFVTGISTTVANCMVLLISTDDTDSNTAQHSSQANSNLGSIAERVDVNTNAGTPGGGFQITEGTLTVAGAIGTWTTTLAANSAKAYLTLALQPPQETTTDQTITALGRITVTTDRTITALGRITATTDRTITALGRIQKTIDALARVTGITDKTITALGRITATTDRTITSIANITTGTTVDQTITSLARITVTTDKAIDALGRITATTDRTITAIGRVDKTIDQVMDALARITATTDKTITSLARIENTTDRSITALARIQKTVDQAITSVGNIVITADRTITSLARIVATTDQIITSIAEIQGPTVTSDQTITSLARIEQTVDSTITGRANILRVIESLSFVTEIPTGDPGPDFAIRYRISGGAVTMYVWDKDTLQWLIA